LYDRPVRELVVDGKAIMRDGSAYVIAEIGNNHQGDLEKAKALIPAARECGVDAVKFQKRANRLRFTRAFYDAPYDNENSYGRT
jgi:sialic acid synthase